MGPEVTIWRHVKGKLLTPVTLPPNMKSPSHWELPLVSTLWNWTKYFSEPFLTSVLSFYFESCQNSKLFTKLIMNMYNLFTKSCSFYRLFSILQMQLYIKMVQSKVISSWILYIKCNIFQQNYAYSWSAWWEESKYLKTFEKIQKFLWSKQKL